jgi:hypothetical protein
MIPLNKDDNAALEKLERATDNEVIEQASHLLEWLQDRNWPVFDRVVKRLSLVGDKIVDPICVVLSGNDSIWKANVIGFLIPSFEKDEQLLYKKALEDLWLEHRQEDIVEGVIDYIEMLFPRTN